MESVLITRDSKGKIRLMELMCESNSEIGHIYRKSGLLGGKMTEQPTIEITIGKQKRDIEAQTTLQFMSLRKKAMDKGYKELDNPLSTYTIADLETIVGKNKTNQDGIIKPMLAKQANSVTNKKIFDKEWYASRKLDGLRCLLYLNSVDEIHTVSRGGKNYDMAIAHIIEDPITVKFFKENPTIILDGELYKHGVSLQTLSGYCRKEDETTDWLEFHVYDLIDTSNMDMPFKDRLKLIQRFSENYDFDNILFCIHDLVSGWDNMMKLHNEFVSDGYEGVVIRDPNAAYKPAGRTNIMIKIKNYLDSCVTIIGKEAGLRGSEDMVFICQLKDGKTFKAKPFGTRETKEFYWNNFDQIKGKIGELKYFYLSDDGTPLQPSLKCIRYDITEPDI